MEYTVIIPAYNEEKAIEQAITQTITSLSLLSKDYEVIIVDDGSQDNTVKTVKKLLQNLNSKTLRLVELKHNRGKGAAIQAGVAQAQGEMIAFLDADLATRPDELRKGFALLEHADLAIASRRIPDASIQKPQPWYRSLAGQAFNLFLRSYLSLPYRDTQCGCKIFRKHAAKTLFSELKTKGWTFDVELLVKAQNHGYSIKEFPVTWRNGKTTRVCWRDAGSIWKDLLRIKKENN